ncbi:MAG: hypothetical protein IJX89_01000 [Alphaproteobacteria bacterium]|nr:hypothetical protein [Alphaproteobacteria bacterium]
MAKKINNFWSRLCGLCVGVFSAIFGVNRAEAAVAECYTNLKDRILTCAEQGYEGALDENGSSLSDSESYYDTVTAIYRTGVSCSDTNLLPYTYGCDFDSYMCVVKNANCTVDYCMDANTDTDSVHYTCSARELYEGSAGMGVSVVNGMVGYTGPQIVGAAYRCNPESLQIEVVAYCYDNYHTLFGCGGGVDADGNLKAASDNSLKFTVNSSGQIQRTYAATLDRYNSGLGSVPANDSAGLAGAMASLGYSCTGCAVPATGGITSSDVQYAGDTSVGSVFNPESCYFSTSTSESSSDKFTDCTGTFYYPMSSGQVCDCWYNRGMDGLAVCS